MKIYRIRRVCEGGNDYLEVLGIKSVFYLRKKGGRLRWQKYVAALRAVEAEIARAEAEPFPVNSHLLVHYKAVLEQLESFRQG